MSLLLFSTARYNGFTYEEVLLNPIADAFGAVVKPWTIIHFALQVRLHSSSDKRGFDRLFAWIKLPEIVYPQSSAHVVTAF